MPPPSHPDPAPSPSAPPPAAGGGDAARQAWVDRLKGLALVWIFVNHAAEQIWGGASLGNPNPDWPPLSERLNQWLPVPGYGLLSIPVNLFRYLGWLGDQAVSLFLIASGFGLAWSLLKSEGRGPVRWGEFFARRVWRIYPLWWAAHFTLLAQWFVYSLPQGSASTLFLSLVGIRATRSTFEYYSPSWWFIGLLIQLYVVFPVLWIVMKKFGPAKVLIGSLLGGTLARGLGLMFLSGYLVPWIRGSIFITRLPEFVVGMALAFAFHRAPEETAARLRSRSTWMVALGLYLGGTALSLTWSGMSVAPWVVGLGVFGMVYPLLSRTPSGPGLRVLSWTGVHSYSLYLVHQTMLGRFVKETAVLSPGVLARILAAAVSSVLAGLFMEWIVRKIEDGLGRRKARFGLKGLILRLGVLGAGMALLLAGGELLTRRVDPMEVQGWGERPSLAADPELGWKLRPAATTRLRWESYDYTVNSNALGFPGPDYPEPRSPRSLRILTTGDAFTSAEGVDTDQAWPRQLEADLARLHPSRKVEILNFAITGYGPQQYASVVRQYVPKFRPDLVIVEVFVNDFSDALASLDEVREGIGFELPHPDHWRSWIRLVNLRMWLKHRCLTPLVARLRHVPEPNGYMLGCFGYLHRGPDRIWSEGSALIARHLEDIRSICDRSGARLLVVMAPAAAQVCTPSQLAYYPAFVDLSDASKYDLDRPQEIIRRITTDLGIPFIDLRPVLRAAPECAFQPRNMHWTRVGHRTVAEHLVRYLAQNPSLLPAAQD